MKIQIFAILVFLFTVAATAAVPLHQPPGAGSVNFLAIGKPSMLKIHGQAPGPEAQLSVDKNAITGTIRFALTKLDTGIELRNTHMKEKYLQVQEFPEATLTLTEAKVEEAFLSSLSTGGQRDFKGRLSLHGREQDVAGTYEIAGGKVEAKFSLKLSDFAIDLPSYLGVKVAESVDVSVQFPIERK